MYDQKPQRAVGGTKHTITTNENEIIHQKRASKPMKLNFQIPLSRRGKMREAQMEDLQPQTRTTTLSPLNEAVPRYQKKLPRYQTKLPRYCEKPYSLRQLLWKLPQRAPASDEEERN